MKGEETIAEKSTEVDQLKKDVASLKAFPAKLSQLKASDLKETVEKYEKLKRAYHKIEKEQKDTAK